MHSRQSSGPFRGELGSALKQMSSENHLKTSTLGYSFLSEFVSELKHGVASQLNAGLLQNAANIFSLHITHYNLVGKINATHR